VKACVRNGIELTRLIGLERTYSIEMSQDGCLARRNESPAKRNETEIRANNDKFDVLQGTLVSWMVIHQARIETIQGKSDANLKEETDASKEEMKDE
jgi:hypothetical protein